MSDDVKFRVMSAPLSFVPYADRMIVRVIGRSKRTKSGLHVPDMALDNTPFLRAEVLFTGPGRISPTTGEYVPIQFKSGSIVVFFRGGSMAAEQLVIPDEEMGNDASELMIIREAHVAWEVKGLERVSGIVDDTGRSMVLSS